MEDLHLIFSSYFIELYQSSKFGASKTEIVPRNTLNCPRKQFNGQNKLPLQIILPQNEQQTINTHCCSHCCCSSCCNKNRRALQKYKLRLICRGNCPSVCLSVWDVDDDVSSLKCQVSTYEYTHTHCGILSVRVCWSWLTFAEFARIYFIIDSMLHTN